MLEPYRVIDLSDERGLLCGAILADLGADVIRVEPTGGNRARGVAPTGMLWEAWARNSRGLVLDLERSADREVLRDLATRADFFVESEAPGRLAALGLGAADLLKANPSLVYVSITPWGQDGPRAQQPATDLTLQAASGVSILTGEAGRPPLHLGGHHSWAHAGAEAAAAALVAHHARIRTGCGQHVDVSAQQALTLATAFMLLADPVGWPARSTRSGGGISVGPIRIPTLFRSADGVVCLTFFFGASQGPYSRRLMEWIHDEGECDAATRDKDWIGYLAMLMSGEEPMSELDRVLDVITRFVARRSSAELFAGARDRNVMLVPCPTLTEVLGDEHLDARGAYWSASDLPGNPKVPGAFVRASTSPLSYRRRAPNVGEHQHEVLVERRTPAWERTGDLGPALGGLRVLDFSWVMAGPYATRVLADFGATVVKIESSRRLDGIRVLPPFVAGQQHPEHSAPFQSCNAGKLSVELDPSTPDGRAVIADLVRWADVVAESFSPKVMAGWGLGYDDLRRIRPDVVMLSSSIFGQFGPHALMPGVGTMGAARAGFSRMTGHPGRLETGPNGPYTDFVAPRLAVAALLAAVDHRNRTGEGNHLDLSQLEASLCFIAPELYQASLRGEDPRLLGNRDPQMVPHGIYPASDGDSWVAIACRDDRDWQTLCDVIGESELGTDPNLRAADRRREREDEIDDWIARWTSARSAAETEALLSAADVPVAELLDHASWAADPQLVHRQHLVSGSHALHGSVLVESTHLGLQATPGVVERGGPMIGEHTDVVLRSILGYDDERIARLRENGTVGPGHHAGS